MANVEKKHEKQKALEIAHMEFVEKCRAIFGKNFKIDFSVEELPLSTIAEIAEQGELKVFVNNNYGAFSQTMFSVDIQTEFGNIELSHLQ